MNVFSLLDCTARRWPDAAQVFASAALAPGLRERLGVEKLR